MVCKWCMYGAVLVLISSVLWSCFTSNCKNEKKLHKELADKDQQIIKLQKKGNDSYSERNC